MKLPSGKNVHSFTPIYLGSNFTWGEATNNCTRSIQTLIIDNKIAIDDVEIEDKIITTAKRLDTYRSLLGGRPIKVNSWYRPQRFNQAVGGGRHSRHQYGDAVDIRSNYRSPHDVYYFLDEMHLDGGLGKYYGFTHVDFRGVRARWHG